MTRHAIVVGASSGIGTAVVSELVGRSWGVSALARRAGAIAGAARSIQCDVTDDASVETALGRAIVGGGMPTALIYSAGMVAAGKTLDVPAHAAREAFEVNFWGVVRVVRRIYPPMAEAGRGSIVVVLSIAALRAVPFEAHYAASKAACARWLECLALEAKLAGVRVAYVAPGYVPTGFLERAGWYGMEMPPVKGSGLGAGDVAHAVVAAVEGRRSRVVVGWRENAIAMADRVLPGAYDRIAIARIRRDRRS
jgi:short-subunit dehydrogenase